LTLTLLPLAAMQVLEYGDATVDDLFEQVGL
jgi:hypothetical protein